MMRAAPRWLGAAALVLAAMIAQLSLPVAAEAAHEIPEQPIANMTADALFDRNLHPQVAVQSKFMEGWVETEHFARVPTHRIVISTFLKDVGDDAQPLPMPLHRIRVRVNQGTLVAFRESRLGVERLTLSADGDTVLMTNVAGRTTLMVPVEQAQTVRWTMPLLLVQTPQMDAGDWVAAPIHDDFLSAVAALGDSVPGGPVVAIAAQAARAAVDSELAAHAAQSRDNATARLSKRHLVAARARTHHLGMPYCDATNQVASHVTVAEHAAAIDSNPKIPAFPNKAFQHRLGRSGSGAPVTPHLERRSLNAGSPSSTETLSEYMNGRQGACGAIEAINVQGADENGRLVVHVYEPTCDGSTGARRKLVKRSLQLAALNDAVSLANAALAISMTGPLQFVRNLMHALVIDYGAVLNVQRLLRHYTVIQMPLLKAALESQTQEKWENAMSNRTDEWQASATLMMGRLFGDANVKPAAMERLARARFAQTAGRKEGNRRMRHEAALERRLSNVQTLQAQDYIVEHAADAEFVDKVESARQIARMRELGESMRTGLAKMVVDETPIDADMASVVEKAVGGIVSGVPLRMIESVSGLVGLMGRGLTRVLAAFIWQYLPKMIDYMGGLYELRIKVPFLRAFYRRVVARGEHDLTLLDLFSLAVALPSQIHYSFFNKGAAFVTREDADVLTATQNPMSLLFRWMTDPRTAPKAPLGSKEYDAVQYHRECVLDWLIRIGMYVATDIGVKLSWLPRYADSIGAAQRTVAIANPIVSQIGALCMFVSGSYVYPTDQVMTLDPAALHDTLVNPDQTWFWWWAVWYVPVAIKLTDTVWREPFRWADLALSDDSANDERRRKIANWKDSLETYVWLYAVGLPQVYFVLRALGNMFASLDWTNPARVAIAMENTMAWYYDTRGFVLPLVAEMDRHQAGWSAVLFDHEKTENWWVIMTRNDIKMLSFYYFRFYIMMQSKLYGLSDYRVPAIDPLTVRNSSVTGL